MGPVHVCGAVVLLRERVLLRGAPGREGLVDARGADEVADARAAVCGVVHLVRLLRGRAHGMAEPGSRALGSCGSFLAVACDEWFRTGRFRTPVAGAVLVHTLPDGHRSSVANPGVGIAKGTLAGAGGDSSCVCLLLRTAQSLRDAMVCLLQRSLAGRVAVFLRWRAGAAGKLVGAQLPCAELDVLGPGPRCHLRGTSGALSGDADSGELPVDCGCSAASARCLEASAGTSVASVACFVGIPCVCLALLLRAFPRVDRLAAGTSGMVGVRNACSNRGASFGLGGIDASQVPAARVARAVRRQMRNFQCTND